jgi:hypothetical protein
METTHDAIGELTAITAEMAEMQDLGGRKFGDLLEKRHALIRRLMAEGFDAGDRRFESIIKSADQLQERLRQRADSIREELSGLQATEALMRAVRSTFNAPEESELNIRA